MQNRNYLQNFHRLDWFVNNLRRHRQVEAAEEEIHLAESTVRM